MGENSKGSNKKSEDVWFRVDCAHLNVVKGQIIKWKTQVLLIVSCNATANASHSLNFLPSWQLREGLPGVVIHPPEAIDSG